MKIIIQAGHSARTSGSTGASGEMTFNIDIADKLANRLRTNGFEVKRVIADPTNADIAGDWDLFLTIHADADIYQKGGGFLDRPAVDGAEARSKAILEAIESTYFSTTGIVNVPSRRNANTRNYYMWSKLSSATPCVLIECGVLQHKPDDYEVLFNKRDLVVDGIYKGILKAFNLQGDNTMANMYKGYDLNNPESMKVAVDVLVRLQAGEFVEASKVAEQVNVKTAELSSKISNYESKNTVLTEQNQTLTDKLQEAINAQVPTSKGESLLSEMLPNGGKKTFRTDGSEEIEISYKLKTDI